MRYFIPFLLSAVAASLIFVTCKPKGEAQLDYIPLREFKYTPTDITPGSEIELLAFSGGKKADENNIYYYQFIGINKASGDTVRIISSLISVDKSAGLENKTYTTPLQYDPVKGITTAEFEPPDSTHGMLNQFNSENENLTEDKIKDIIENKRSDKEEFVVINKNIDLFHRDYKAAFGVLNFKKIPW